MIFRSIAYHLCMELPFFMCSILLKAMLERGECVLAHSFFHLFYDGSADMQICTLLTRGQCIVSDIQMTVGFLLKIQH